MKLSELIDALQQIQDDIGDTDPEVRLAVQPNYPLQITVGGAMLCGDENPMVFVYEGVQEGYLIAEAAQDIGWR